jgi:hypothetical protein
MTTKETKYLVYVSFTSYKKTLALASYRVLTNLLFTTFKVNSELSIEIMEALSEVVLSLKIWLNVLQRTNPKKCINLPKP